MALKPVPSTSRLPRVPRPVLIAAMIVFLLRASLAFLTYGSTDILLFEAELAKIEQDGAVALYRRRHQNQVVRPNGTAAGRFPWYLANSPEHPAWNGRTIGLGLICWLVVCRITLIYVRRLLACQTNSFEERSDIVGPEEESP